MNNPSLLKAYGQALQPKSNSRKRRSKPTKSTLFPINQGGLGSFPYRWEIPTGFNNYTYHYFDHGFTLDIDTGVLSAKGGYHDQYLSALKAVNFKLSSADTLKLNQAYTLRKSVIDIILNKYKTAFGPISDTDISVAESVLGYSIQSDSNYEYNYIVLYIIAYEWSGAQAKGSAPIALEKWAKTLDPFSELKAVPADKILICRSIVMQVVNLFLGADELLKLIDLRGQSVEVLKIAIQSIMKPSKSNGALDTINNSGGKTLLPAWQISPSVQQIEQSLKNGASSFDLKMTVKIAGIGSLTVSINDGEKIKTTIDPLLLTTADGKQFDPLSFSGAGSIYISTKTFKGKTLVNINPLAVSEINETGWAVDNIIQQAIANGPKDITGYYFSHRPDIDFSKKGTLGQLVQLEICQLPTIAIYYQEGNIKEFLKSFPITEKWDLSWLGLPNASNKIFAYSAKVVSSTYGFTVFLSPDPALPNTGSLQDTVYVIGGAIKWLK